MSPPPFSGYTESYVASGGRALYSRYVRRGAPTVVFIAGLGDGSDSWDAVQAAISQETSTFSYDRAGIGRSQAVLGPRTCLELAEELSEILQKLDIEQPYILVGHSLGGLVARLYASSHPELVTGMVLIDAAPEYKELAYEKVLPDKLAAKNREYYSNPMLNSERIDKPQSYKQAAEHSQQSNLNLSIIIRGLPGADHEDWPNEEILRIDQRMQADFRRLSTLSRCRMAAGSGHYIHHDEPEIVIEEITAMVKGDGTMNETRSKLKLDLQRIEEEQYQLREGEEIQDFIALMLQYIGDLQPELRDELIYPTFYEWIESQSRFTAAELREMLMILTDEEHLLYRIGSEEDSSVFTRAFSVLVIVLIVRSHRHHPFLTQEDFLNLKHSLLRYYREEKDFRGYLPEEGWAHSPAHGADALVELVQCPESDSAVRYEVLDAIYRMLNNGKQSFGEEEDERMASIVDVMIDSGLLPRQDITDWISTLTQCVDRPRSREQMIDRVNSKNFLRCLYFRRREGTRDESLTASLLAAEAKVNKFRH